MVNSFTCFFTIFKKKYSVKCHSLFIPATLFPSHPYFQHFSPSSIFNQSLQFLVQPSCISPVQKHMLIYPFISSSYMNGSILHIVFMALLFSAFCGNQFLPVRRRLPHSFLQLHGTLISVHVPNILIQLLSYVWAFRLFPVFCNNKHTTVNNLMLFSFCIISDLSSGQISRNGIAEAKGKYMCDCVRYCRIVVFPSRRGIPICIPSSSV